MPNSGRIFCVVTELTYLAGTIPPETLAAVTASVRRSESLWDLAFGVRAADRDTVLIAATLRQTDPVAAITEVAGVVDRALLTTGLFEEFDVTGKVLRVAPAEAGEPDRQPARPEAGTVTIQLRGRVSQGRWDDLMSFLTRAIPFYEGPGGIHVRLLRDVADPDAFIEVIEYETAEAYAADQHRVENDPAMIARLEEWRGLLAGPIEVQTLNEIIPGRRRITII